MLPTSPALFTLCKWWAVIWDERTGLRAARSKAQLSLLNGHGACLDREQLVFAILSLTDGDSSPTTIDRFVISGQRLDSFAQRLSLVSAQGTDHETAPTIRRVMNGGGFCSSQARVER